MINGDRNLWFSVALAATGSGGSLRHAEAVIGISKEIVMLGDPDALDGCVCSHETGRPTGNRPVLKVNSISIPSSRQQNSA